MTTQISASALPDRRVLIALLLFVLAGGGASAAIRISYAQLAPFWAAASRFALAALAFWAIVYYRKLLLPKGRALLGALIFGTLIILGIAFTVGGAAPVDISLPHLAGIILAAIFIAEGDVLIKKFPLNFLIGAWLVLAGVLVGALLPSKTKSAPVEECKDRSRQVLPRCV